ncbi:MAG TPA: hypothetical protein VE574_00990, partial [Nitrososphaeraceae archaeon]|nr:hypothetical protein [Nitrososphaeraceae archaeon]
GLLRSCLVNINTSQLRISYFGFDGFLEWERLLVQRKEPHRASYSNLCFTFCLPAYKNVRNFGF